MAAWDSLVLAEANEANEDRSVTGPAGKRSASKATSLCIVFGIVFMVGDDARFVFLGGVELVSLPDDGMGLRLGSTLPPVMK